MIHKSGQCAYLSEPTRRLIYPTKAYARFSRAKHDADACFISSIRAWIKSKVFRNRITSRITYEDGEMSSAEKKGERSELVLIKLMEVEEGD